METQTTRITDSQTSAVCDRMAAQAVTAKIIEAGAGKVQPKDSAVVKNAEARALAFKPGKHSDSESLDAAAAQSPIVKLAEARAAEFEASKRSGHAGQ